MDIELILQKFAVFSGLTGEELQACLPYCRDAMEQLGPYQGLVQKYAVPFTPQRHEALSPANIIFTRYTDDDQLIPFKKGKPTHPRGAP